jgi:hypothetical protein
VFWVLVFAGIALLGLIMVVSYVVWLAHKASDLLSEVHMVLERLGELGEILGQIRLPAVGGEEEAATEGAAPVSRAVGAGIAAGSHRSGSGTAAEPAAST